MFYCNNHHTPNKSFKHKFEQFICFHYQFNLMLGKKKKKFCLYSLASSHGIHPSSSETYRSFHSLLNRISFHAKLASTPMLEAATVSNNNKMWLRNTTYFLHITNTIVKRTQEVIVVLLTMKWSKLFAFSTSASCFRSVALLSFPRLYEVRQCFCFFSSLYALLPNLEWCYCSGLF